MTRAHCWFVDDVEGGGAPKAVGDTNTNHPTGSTTCSALGRPATCGVIAPGEHVWVKYAFVNSASADACRFLNAPKTGAPVAPPPTRASAGRRPRRPSGQCFGRQPDGAGWSPGPVACTQGGPQRRVRRGNGMRRRQPLLPGRRSRRPASAPAARRSTASACGSGATCQAGTCGAAAPGSAPVDRPPRDERPSPARHDCHARRRSSTASSWSSAKTSSAWRPPAERPGC